jgi:hypothetical protein
MDRDRWDLQKAKRIRSLDFSSKVLIILLNFLAHEQVLIKKKSSKSSRQNQCFVLQISTYFLHSISQERSIRLNILKIIKSVYRQNTTSNETVSILNIPSLQQFSKNLPLCWISIFFSSFICSFSHNKVGGITIRFGELWILSVVFLMFDCGRFCSSSYSLKKQWMRFYNLERQVRLTLK